MAAAAGGRPRSARGGSSKTNLAYDLGHKGEAMPEWVQDHPAYIDAYEEGVSDRDYTGGADTGAHPDKPARQRSADDNVVPITDAPSAPASTPASGPSEPSKPWAGQVWPDAVSSGAGKAQGAVIKATGSIGSAILGAFAYALFINVLNGTGTKWLSAKWTNGDGKLP